MEPQIDMRGLFDIRYRPINREQKRIAEKEYEQIKKVMVPIIYGYLATCEETMGFDNPDFKKACMTSFISSIPKAQAGNKIVFVNRDFFARFVPPFSETIQVVQEKKYSKRRKMIAIGIIIFVVLFVLSIFASSLG